VAARRDLAAAAASAAAVADAAVADAGELPSIPAADDFPLPVHCALLCTAYNFEQAEAFEQLLACAELRLQFGGPALASEAPDELQASAPCPPCPPSCLCATPLDWLGHPWCLAASSPPPPPPFSTPVPHEAPL
jgi:hypothetical protein